MNRPDYLFLIGGSDLEMVTIKQLLTANGFAEGQNIADHNLAWGAKLSDYQENFDFLLTYSDFVLTLNIQNLSNVIDLDFYKERGSKAPSSLHIKQNGKSIR